MAEEEEIGKGTHPAQNPPPLDEADRFVMTWYFRMCPAFLREIGLSSIEIGALNLSAAAKEIFLYKLQKIHNAMIKIWERETQKKTNG
jgi:hypothetical protein